MSLQRREHWATRSLHPFLIERATMPFQWGSNDCALFACDAILAVTGTDIAGEFRGKYTTQLGAFRTIKTITGGSTVADAAVYCASKLGLTEYNHPLMAKRGDLVIINNGGALIAGIVHLSGCEVVSISEQGIVRLPITSVVRAWSI